MLVSTNTNAFFRRFGDEKTIKMIAEAGFTAYDMSMAGRPDIYAMSDDEHRAYFNNLRASADSFGIVCNQAHAPFHSSTGNPEEDEKIFRNIARSIEAAAILGAKNIIVHPKQHLEYAFNIDVLREMNMEFYNRLIPYAEKNNIHICVENMWRSDKNTHRIIDSTCSRAEEFCDYIDSIGSEWVVGCLDIGHVPLTGENERRIISMLGGKRLKALHVHDTDGVSDLHTLPFLSKIDMIEVMTALGEIGYDGDLTFESDCFTARMPNELIPAALRFMNETGKYLVSVIENNKK